MPNQIIDFNGSNWAAYDDPCGNTYRLDVAANFWNANHSTMGFIADNGEIVYLSCPVPLRRWWVGVVGFTGPETGEPE